jgi:hypothetical protein
VRQKAAAERTLDLSGRTSQSMRAQTCALSQRVRLEPEGRGRRAHRLLCGWSIQRQAAEALGPLGRKCQCATSMQHVVLVYYVATHYGWYILNVHSGRPPNQPPLHSTEHGKLAAPPSPPHTSTPGLHATPVVLVITNACRGTQ